MPRPIQGAEGLSGQPLVVMGGPWETAPSPGKGPRPGWAGGWREGKGRLGRAPLQGQVGPAGEASAT